MLMLRNNNKTIWNFYFGVSMIDTTRYIQKKKKRVRSNQSIKFSSFFLCVRLIFSLSEAFSVSHADQAVGESFVFDGTGGVKDGGQIVIVEGDQQATRVDNATST